jgi:exodeoxyribonuclease VII large subunit
MANSLTSDHPFDPDTGELLDTALPNVAEYSVSEISFALKRTLEETYGHVRVRGEISGYRGAHTSGHCYFALKDEKAKLEAVIWKGTFGRLRSKLQEGLEVVATGKISSYPGSSKYQLIVENVEPAGAGALMALLEERKKKLAAEGLFDPARKKPLPYLPRLIGVVTSPTGAVIRDILHRLNDRFPRHVIVWPVRVQGETCAAEVAAAIAGFNAMSPRPDLLIVARGGGSLEDLWGFNEEIVVRAAAASAIPLISGVGHETDTTLIDFAADWRAPTPTAAAEKAVPVRDELLADMASLTSRLRQGLVRVMDERRTRVRAAARALPRPEELLAFARQRLDSATARLPRALGKNTQDHRLRLTRALAGLTARPLLLAVSNRRQRATELAARSRRALRTLYDKCKQRFEGEAKLLTSLSYRSVLQRGYALVRDEVEKPVRFAESLRSGQTISIEFQDGKKTAKIAHS